MKRVVILSLSLTVTSCAAIDQKRQTYENVANMVANPEVVEIHYKREGGTSTFLERRCTGSLCNDEQREFVTFDEGNPEANE